MGTKVHCESLYSSYHHSMRDLNNESNGCRWPLLYSDNKTDQSNNGFTSQTTFGYDKDVLRRTMLQHEAVFKTQVLELHRVYGIQKDMMDELKRKQLNNECGPIEAANNDFHRWKIPNSNYDRPSMSVVADNGHSPMKGSNSQGVVGSVPWQNGGNSKNVEMLEIRPTKIRKRMIDLCLPADEYIDDSEEVLELKDRRVCGTSSQLPNGDSLRSGYRLCSRSNGLADLNEPLKSQETNEFAHGHSRNGEFQGHIRDYGKALNSATHVISLHPDENGKTKVWSHQPLRIATTYMQPAKPLDSSSQVLMNGSQRVMGLNSFGPPSKAVLWRERTVIDLEADTETNTSHEVIHEPSLASHQPPRHLYPYNPLDSAVQWNHLHTSWQNPNFGFPQKVASVQKQGYIGNRLQYESNSRFGNTSYSNHIAYYNECSSSSKSKFSETSNNNPNGGRSDYRSANPLMDSNLNGSEKKFVRDLNLNVTLSNTSVIEVRKDEEHLATLPWLIKPKSACNSEVELKSNDAVPSSSLKPLELKNESGNKVQNLARIVSLKSGSCSNQSETEKINAKLIAYRGQSDAERDKVHKVRMLDINEPCEPLSDEFQQAEEQTGTKFLISNRCQIDLNMLVSEDECENLSVPTSSVQNLKAPMFDLEVPAVPEPDDDDISGIKPLEETPIEDKPPENEILAAETIVDISSACLDRELEVVALVEASEPIILHWFAETVDTHRDNLDQKLTSFSRNQARSIEEIDYFESMTLQLPEIPEDEYMPKPLVPADLKLEETALVTSQRPRRGNARKGKQRRDFQRDILPGLVSLSKHEVTEDIHMFDGFMREAGSSWTPTGLSRKKTGSRGRPRRVITIPEPVQAPVTQHVSNEMGLVDRSFAGWGNMTRRPRRQRCPSASNQRSSSSHAPFT